MRLKLDLCGIEMNLRIKQYEKADKDNWDCQWCRIDCLFHSKSWLNYQITNDEILLSCEVEELAKVLDDLLNDKLLNKTTLDFIEPDFNFILYPKRHVHTLKGYEIGDISMEMEVFFWNGVLTENHLSLTFYREDIQYLKNYLLLVMGELQQNDSEIMDMISNGILLPEYL